MARSALVAGALLALCALAAYMGWEAVVFTPPEADASPALPGTYYPSQGNQHLPNGAPFTAYSTDPPTSGPHWIGAGALYRTPSGRVLSIPPAWGVYTEPLPREMLVHSMEHGGVVVWYGPGCDPACSAELAALVERYAAHGRHVLLVPYPALRTPVALTAWTRLELLYGPDATAVERFVLAHDRRYDPEGL